MTTTESDADLKPYLIVTGSSAGGIDALIALVTGLPADFAAPVVVAQHLAPGHASRLAEILRNRTKLQVRTVEGREELRPGTIFLVGPDRDIEIVDDAAEIVAIVRKGPKPSIDRLFASAAASHGERLVAIIFSGMGSDGLAGARVVKEHGGTVIVQEPASASFPSMPLAIPPTLIDLAARPEDIPPLLVEYLRTSALPPASSDRTTLQTLLGQVRERSGVDFSQYKTPTIMRRLARLMVAVGAASIDEYLVHLQSHPEEYQRLVNAFLIKVTGFFRDAQLFDHLRTDIFPTLIAQAHEYGNELRIWSAGTSTGEEAYSLAILCAELLREDEERITVRIFATDLDEAAIAFARRGLYSKDSLKNFPQAWIQRYFVRIGDAYEVGKRIRNMTVFGQHDLARRAPFPRIDLCLCRNVLIYFTKELQTRALQLFAFSLRDGGYLALGKAESTGALGDYFRLADSTLRIFQRQGERILIPSSRLNDTQSHQEERAGYEKTSGRGAYSPRPLTSGTSGALLAGSSIGIVVVDRQYDIVSVNAAARALLEIHAAGVGEDLIHLARNIDSNELRTLVDAAFRNEPAAPRELAIHEASGGAEKWLQLSASNDRAPHAEADTIGLFIVDVTASVGRRRELERNSSEQQDRVRELTGNVEELTRRQKGLLRANEELTGANAELRDMNEQLLIDAEESASSSEEVETLNEEMQATNEELETLNEELQATVEELNTTNDELESRGGDLERQARLRESEMQRIDAERALIVQTLETLVGPYVVLVGDEDVVYASEAIGGRDEFAGMAPQWWHESLVSIAGRNFTPNVHRPAGNGYTVVALEEIS